MPIFELLNISKSFGKTEVLKNISLSMNKGEVLSVIGPSGGGKTTLLRCINFLETPDTGIIRVNGETLLDCSDKKKPSDNTLRQNRIHFGLVFQQFNLFPQYTIFENVTLAPRLLSKQFHSVDIKNKADELLKQVGLYDKKDAYPCMLSGGQQQRAAIARALALDPDVLCFDEPTSALDPELTGEVQKIIRELRDAKRTMLIVTHEMNFAREVSDAICFVDCGRIIEEGTPEQIFNAPQRERTKQFLGI